jgi:hypothetical protein
MGKLFEMNLLPEEEREQLARTERAVRGHRGKIRLGEYVAEFYVNDKFEPATFHYVISKRGANEILNWGMAYSLEDAQKEARDLIRFMDPANEKIA